MPNDTTTSGVSSPERSEVEGGASDGEDPAVLRRSGLSDRARRVLEARRQERRASAGAGVVNKSYEDLAGVKRSIMAATDAIRRQRKEAKRQQQQQQRASGAEQGTTQAARAGAAAAAMRRFSLEGGDAAATAAPSAAPTASSFGLERAADVDAADELLDDAPDLSEDDERREHEFRRRIEVDDDGDDLWGSMPPPAIVLLPPPRPFAHLGMLSCRPPSPDPTGGTVVVTANLGGTDGRTGNDDRNGAVGTCCWAQLNCGTFELNNGHHAGVWGDEVAALESDGLEVAWAPAGMEPLLGQGHCQGRLVRDAVAAAVEAESRAAERRRNEANFGRGIRGGSRVGCGGDGEGGDGGSGSDRAGEPPVASVRRREAEEKEAGDDSATDHSESDCGMDGGGGTSDGKRRRCHNRDAAIIHDGAPLGGDASGASAFFSAPGVLRMLPDPLLPVAVRRERPPTEDAAPVPPALRTVQPRPVRGVGAASILGPLNGGSIGGCGASGSSGGAGAFSGGGGGSGSGGGGGESPAAELRVAVSRMALHDHPCMGPEDRLFVRMRVLFGQYRAALEGGEAEHLRGRLGAVVAALVQRRWEWEQGSGSEGGGSGSSNGGGSGKRGSNGVKGDASSAGGGAGSAEEQEDLRRLWADALGTLSGLVAAEAGTLALARRLRWLWGELQEQRRQQRFVSTPARLTARPVRRRCWEEAEEREGGTAAGAAGGGGGGEDGGEDGAPSFQDNGKGQDAASALDRLLSDIRSLHCWLWIDVFGRAEAAAAATAAATAAAAAAAARSGDGGHGSSSTAATAAAAAAAAAAAERAAASAAAQEARLNELLEACRGLLPHALTSGKWKLAKAATAGKHSAAAAAEAGLRLTADGAMTSDASPVLPTWERARRRAVRQQWLYAEVAVNGEVVVRSPARPLRWPAFTVGVDLLIRLKVVRRPESVQIRICRHRPLWTGERVAAVFAPLPGAEELCGGGQAARKARTHGLAPKAQWCQFAAERPMDSVGLLAMRHVSGAVLVGTEWATGVDDAPPASAEDFSNANATCGCPPPSLPAPAHAPICGQPTLWESLVSAWSGRNDEGARPRRGNRHNPPSDESEALLGSGIAGDSGGGGSWGGGKGLRALGGRDTRILQLLPKAGELDPNDPANAAVLRLLNSAPPPAGSLSLRAAGIGTVGAAGEAAAGGAGADEAPFRTREPERLMVFSGYGAAALAVGVAVRYPYTDPRRWRESARHTLLRLRQARPGLVPRPVPLLEAEAHGEETLQELLDRYAAAAATANGLGISSIADAIAAGYTSAPNPSSAPAQTTLAAFTAAGSIAAASAVGNAARGVPAWSPEAGAARIAVDDERLRDFVARLRQSRAAYSRTAGRRRATYASVVREVAPMEVGGEFVLGNLLPRRRRALRPQIVSARNVPVRVAEDAGGFAFVAAGAAAVLSRRDRNTAAAAAAGRGASAGANSGRVGAGNARGSSGGGGDAAGAGFSSYGGGSVGGNGYSDSGGGAGGSTLNNGDDKAGGARGYDPAVAAAELEDGRASVAPNQVCSFVEVRFQRARRRTGTFEGQAPLWRETVEMPFVPPEGNFTPAVLGQVKDAVCISLFDEVHFDDRPRGGFLDPEDEREGLRTEKHFLGTVSIPFQTVYAAGTVDALLRLETPPVNLGYRQAREGGGGGGGGGSDEGDGGGSGGTVMAAAGSGGGIDGGGGSGGANGHAAEGGGEATDGLRGAAASDAGAFTDDASNAAALRDKSERSTYIRVMATLDPLPERPTGADTTSSSGGGGGGGGLEGVANDDVPLARAARRWLEAVRRTKHWPAKRQAALFVPGLDGDSALITRYLTPQAPPEGMDTIAKCAHFVRLVPFLDDWQAFDGGHDVWCTSQQFLDVLAGDWEEHAILLHNYILYLIETGNSAAAAATAGGDGTRVKQRRLEGRRNRGKGGGGGGRRGSGSGGSARDNRGSGARNRSSAGRRRSGRSGSGSSSDGGDSSGSGSGGGSTDDEAEDAAALATVVANNAVTTGAVTSGRRHLAVFLVMGTGVPEGDTVYVMVQELAAGGGRGGGSGGGGAESGGGGSGGGGAPMATTLWNASTGEGYDARDPRCPLSDIATVVSRYNVWANVQRSGRPREMSFDINDPTCWRSFFSWPANPAPPQPPPSMQPPLHYRPTDAALCYEVEELIREGIKREMRRWRARRGVTAFNAGVGHRLAELLPLLEASALAGGGSGGASSSGRSSNGGVLGGSGGGADADEHRRRLEPTMRSRDLVGFPLHFGFTDVDAAVNRVRATGVHECRHPEVQFALAVQAFPYASNVLSVWVYVAAIMPR